MRTRKAGSEKVPNEHHLSVLFRDEGKDYGVQKNSKAFELRKEMIIISIASTLLKIIPLQFQLCFSKNFAIYL